ncbi:MAG: 2'-deoxycytidine 5'-triphosphate deaminase [Candidatus Nanohaloarchaeota archaeon QJJ-9]|nr:2'-deoxycytidine 5'-triphosphate deaminase [Candidatus Nanohaloarchaeota archaeon QJJ-9]
MAKYYEALEKEYSPGFDGDFDIPTFDDVKLILENAGLQKEDVDRNVVSPIPDEDRRDLGSLDIIPDPNYVFRLDSEIPNLYEKDLSIDNRIDPDSDFILYPYDGEKEPYLIRSKGIYNLPKTVCGRIDARSTIARLGGRIQSVGKNKRGKLEAGYTGPIWMQVVPGQFPLEMDFEEPLAQISFHKEYEDSIPAPSIKKLNNTSEKTYQEIYRDEKEIGLYKGEMGNQEDRVPLNRAIENRGVKFTTNMDLGFIAKDLNQIPGPINISETDVDPTDYFRKMEPTDENRWKLKEGTLHLLMTDEKLDLSKNYGGVIQRNHEFLRGIRIHEAGILDPLSKGYITMEVSSPSGALVGSEFLGIFYPHGMDYGDCENELDFEEKSTSYNNVPHPIPKVFEEVDYDKFEIAQI